MGPAAGIDEASPKRNKREPLPLKKSDLGSSFFSHSGPLGPADLPGKPGCRPTLKL